MYEEKYSPTKFETDWIFHGRGDAIPRHDLLEHEELYKTELLTRIEKNNQLLLKIMDLLNRRLK